MGGASFRCVLSWACVRSSMCVSTACSLAGPDQGDAQAGRVDMLCMNVCTRCAQLALDLSKVMRNLGILAHFEVIQRISKCRARDYIWPAGTEPAHHLDLALYPYLYLRLDLRCVHMCPTAGACRAAERGVRGRPCAQGVHPPPFTSRHSWCKASMRISCAPSVQHPCAPRACVQQSLACMPPCTPLMLSRALAFRSSKSAPPPLRPQATCRSSLLCLSSLCARISAPHTSTCMHSVHTRLPRRAHPSVPSRPPVPRCQVCKGLSCNTRPVRTPWVRVCLHVSCQCHTPRGVLACRWDAHRPVWMAGSSSSDANAPMHTHEPIPSSVEIVSRPSKPVLMRPHEVRQAAARCVCVPADTHEEP